MAKKLTTKFIASVHMIFAELGYKPKNNEINMDDFLDCLEYSIIHSNSIDDAKDALVLSFHALDNWDLVERIFNERIETWNQFPNERRKILKINKERSKCKGIVYLTNSLASDGVLIGQAIYGNRMIKIKKENDKYILKNYIVSSSANMSYRTLILDSKTSKTIASLRFFDDFSNTFDYNLTNYAIINANDGSTLIVDKEYINDLRNLENDSGKVSILSSANYLYASINKTYLYEDETEDLLLRITIYHLKDEDCYEFLLAVALSFFSNNDKK